MFLIQMLTKSGFLHKSEIAKSKESNNDFKNEKCDVDTMENIKTQVCFLSF